MLRRCLCRGLIVLFVVLSASGCGDTKPSAPKASTVPDPEGNAKPKAAGARPG
jgi:hypothetical protein